LLTAVVGYSELLLETLPTGDPSREDVLEIQHAGKRATTLTRQLLAFGRKQLLTPRVLNLNSTVERMHEMLQSTVGEHIALETDLCDLRPRIKADPGQIEQGIVNLVLNARDAMQDGGVLTLSTRVETVEREAARRSIDLLPGRYAVLSVADTGVGMDEETRRRVFEPFFTTKETGKGTGLGLAMVYGIVTQSGGHITVASDLGRGTTVSIFLPLIEEDLPSGVLVAELPVMSQGTETVLLVEDEPTVRRIARRALFDRGYRVIEAEDGVTALEVARTHRGLIDLLLTDVVMPRMSGPELAAELQRELPGLRVLFMSGYARDAFDGGALGADVNFLAKPFTPDRLASRVRQVLDEKVTVSPAGPSARDRRR
jgi:CheY-like chemotaxis protein